MAFASSQITLVASTPTALWQFGGTAPPYVLAPSGYTLQDPCPGSLICASAIYLGGPAVSSSNGFQLPANTALPFTIFGTSEVLYAFSTGTPVVEILFGRQ